MSQVLQDAIRSANRDLTPSPKLNISTPVEVATPSSINEEGVSEIDKLSTEISKNNGVVAGVESYTRSVINKPFNSLIDNVSTGVLAGSNEIVAAAKTGIAAATDNVELRDSAEDTRNSLNMDIKAWRGEEDANMVENIIFSLSKMLALPLGAAGAAGKAGMALNATTKGALTMGTVGATTGVISYQETKQEAMNKGVDRDTANTAGQIMGTGMGASVLVPAAGFGRIATKTRVAVNSVASAAAATAAMSGTQYAAGSYIQSQDPIPETPSRPFVPDYKTAGQDLKDMATDPTSITLGLVLGGAIGGVVGAGKYRQYKQDVALLKKLNNDPLSFVTPELIAEVKTGQVDGPLITKMANDLGMENQELSVILQNPKLDIDLVAYNQEMRDLDPNHIDKTQAELDLELRQDLAEQIRTIKASQLNSNQIDASGVLADSDRMLMMRNEQILQKYYDTGDASLLDQLEIPQVHRDANLLANYELEVKDNYFNVETHITRYNEGLPYTPLAYSTPRATTVATRLSGRNTVMNTIASGEGDYRSLNRGKAGDAPNARLPEDITIAQIQKLQQLPVGHPDRLMAVGRYQLIPSTLQGAVKALKLSPNTKFTPEVQDRIMKDYLLKIKKPQIHAYISGASDDLLGAQLAMAQEFASVGVPAGTTKKGRTLPTDSTFYPGEGNNRASIKSSTIAKDLERAREVYKEAITNGKSADEAWEMAMNPEQVQLSTTVKADIATTTNTNKGGEIFTSPSTRGPDANSAVLVLPSKQSLVDSFKALFRSKENTYDTEVAELRAKYGESMTEEALQSRAIQRVYEEKSYQYALDTRNKAIEFGYKGKELEDITTNAFNSHQANLKAGQSKIYNDEFTSHMSIYRDQVDDKTMSIDEVREIALLTAKAREKLAIFELPPISVAPVATQNNRQTNKLTLEPVKVGESLTIKGQSLKVVEDSLTTQQQTSGKLVRYQNQDGSWSSKRTGASGKQGSPDTVTSTLKLSDGSLVTRISTKLADGNIVTRIIDNQGTRLNGPDAAYLNAVVANQIKNGESVIIDGNVVTKQELQELIKNTEQIDNTALEAFALCSLS